MWRERRIVWPVTVRIIVAALLLKPLSAIFIRPILAHRGAMALAIILRQISKKLCKKAVRLNIKSILRCLIRLIMV